MTCGDVVMLATRPGRIELRDSQTHQVEQCYFSIERELVDHTLYRMP